MSSSTWQEHFKERLIGLEPPREGSYLEYALAEGRLTEDEYLAWAKPALLLPVLDSRFFSEQTPQPELLGRISHAWNSHCFPVFEWDGVITVACLERPEALPATAICVLAPPSAMSFWWERLSEYAGPMEVTGVPEGLDGVDLAADTQAPVLSFAGLTLNRTAESGPVEVAVEVAAEPLAEIPAEVAASAPPVEEAPQNKTPASMHVNSAIEPHVLSPLVVQHKTFMSEVGTALNTMKEQFPKAMFLVVSENGKSILPLAWSDSFGKPNIVSRIPMTTPSPFRVAMATEKPYHGYVVPNDVNEIFAKLWNGGKQPEHLTIAPFFYKGRAMGALLGLGGVECNTQSALRCAERASRMLSEKITDQSKAAA